MRQHSTSFGGEEDSLANKKREDSEADLDITPMIDVVFLLLIFFMVTSTMQDPQTNDPPPAENGVATDSSAATILTINRPEDPSAPITVILSNGNEGSLEDVKADVQQGVAEDRYHVILKADRDVPHGIILEVMRKANEVEGVQFFIEVSDKHK
ncbi:MAG: biopolymer transporter ExbD [Planctomycetaceae bacterium]|nr:biopolymer transporter ExbD [Planctomycetaceae bacterium]